MPEQTFSFVQLTGMARDPRRRDLPNDHVAGAHTTPRIDPYGSTDPHLQKDDHIMSMQHDDTTSHESWTETDPTAGLQTVRFLEGSWHSDGEGPYGPYALDANAEIRGRWMLLTYSITEPTSHDVFYVSTQVYGYDDDGLVLELFDTAGSFTFRSIAVDGEPSDGEHGVRFDWTNEDRKPGQDFWKRSEFQQRDGALHFRYDSMEPSRTADTGNADAAQELSTFEGIWHPGKRPAVD
jgi:hypothetical protein